MTKEHIMTKEQKLTILLLKEKLEKLSGKKVMLSEARSTQDINKLPSLEGKFIYFFRTAAYVYGPYTKKPSASSFFGKGNTGTIEKYRLVRVSEETQAIRTEVKREEGSEKLKVD